MLLFDILGFFNNINHHHLVSIFHALGFPHELVSWLESFLTDHHISLKFNNFTLDPYNLQVGTLQGSPISSVLSIIFVSPILYLTQRWTNTSLSMYIDDGNLFACGTSYLEVTDHLCLAYWDCWNWLNRASLAIKPDKTEVIFFTNSHATHPCPNRIWLADPSHTLEYHIRASNMVRYLGIFFDHKLNWHDHVHIMINQAHSTTMAFCLLGNSICGLDWAQWRTVYNAIILSILTYTAPVWYTGQAALLHELHTA
jgi:reverse transcriptase-like protein